MNREITKISLQGITGVDRIRAIDIISAALALQYHRNILVLNEGYASDAAIEQIPNTVKIFVVEAEKKPIMQEQQETQLSDDKERIIIGMEKVLDNCAIIAE
jgi:hypothetical protein